MLIEIKEDTESNAIHVIDLFHRRVHMLTVEGASFYIYYCHAPAAVTYIVDAASVAVMVTGTILVTIEAVTGLDHDVSAVQGLTKLYQNETTSRRKQNYQDSFLLLSILSEGWLLSFFSTRGTIVLFTSIRCQEDEDADADANASTGIDICFNMGQTEP